MKRDDDLIRDLLFKYEGDADWIALMPGGTSSSTGQEEKEHYHVLLMSDQGLVTSVGPDSFRVTASGHDYINAIRSDTIWRKAKEGAKEIGGATFGILKDLAVAYLKQEAAIKLGLEL
ncbi:DUF2513 domain-containing protein [Puniceibacterium sediminis]|uniref:DUF2513 domain-containing protein n=1 Tax=Puniceibacterium sediminis TaxID=1608407 RepID=A0A238URU0_9RHOB|nr:DUF2513 domain-containing protein [Puniceibacterium sediminis]SNR24860.1 Hypothetical protein SAMN06265370_10149 [Puniceibacterium sediminis]